MEIKAITFLIPIHINSVELFRDYYDVSEEAESVFVSTEEYINELTKMLQNVHIEEEYINFLKEKDKEEIFYEYVDVEIMKVMFDYDAALTCPREIACFKVPCTLKVDWLIKGCEEDKLRKAEQAN
ncbi:hypothetical protein [Butyrivibrio hungatei]|uniref:Uncharacterized protein n=1 Tax=Butyrivibrio hungatei TaxID=185008 RepID=A0A1D9P5Z9_9FIRM|nr:hypothetical protein [Butyrivibrio hungatei]AOZ97933.1 hypothetical protein bhn_II134 [Butyrivibrio hungatei]